MNQDQDRHPQPHTPAPARAGGVAVVRPGSAPAGAGAWDHAFAEFLRVDVANGDASTDTVRSYWTQTASWVDWCRERQVDPATATVSDVRQYRAHLVAAGYKPTSIAHRLTILRRFYAAAVSAGLRPDNPASGVKAPRNKRAAEDFRYLDEGELLVLLRALPSGASEKARRDRALLGLLALYGLRTVEINRANVDDVAQRGEATVLIVRGKGHDRLLYLRPDVAQALRVYLATRPEVASDERGTPMFTAVGNHARGHRLSRRGLRALIDGYLAQAQLKRPGLSNHGLRATAATLAYKHSRDLRAVQELLGHADPRTTSRYARLVDRAKNDPVAGVPVSL